MIIICGAKVDNNRLEYIYWKYSKIYPRRWARRKCSFCLKSEIPPKLYIVRKVPNKEYLKELEEKNDMMTLLHLYHTYYLACEECLKKLNPKREGKY